MSDHAPYTPPEQWVDILRRISDCTEPRLIVSLSAGRGSYRTISDLTPGVSRVDGAGPRGEVVTLHLGGDYAPSGVVDAAGNLYADSCTVFLDSRRADGSSHIRVGRLRLQLLDGDAEIASHSLPVARESFGAADDVVDTSGPSLDALRVLEQHSKSLGAQFLQLARQNNDAAKAERDGILDYARGALELTREAGEYHAAAVGALASAESSSFFDSATGQALVGVVVSELPKLVQLGQLALQARLARLQAVERTPAPSPTPPPEEPPVTVAVDKPERPGRRKRQH